MANTIKSGPALVTGDPIDMVEQYSKLMPEAAQPWIATMEARPEYIVKVYKDMEMIGGNPVDLLPKDGRDWRFDEKMPKTMTAFGHMIDGFSPSDESAEVVHLPGKFLAPVRPMTRVDIEEVLRVAECRETTTPGLWNLFGHKVDLARHEINQKPLMWGSLAVLPSGKAVLLDRDTTMYMVVGLMIRKALTTRRGLEPRAIREALEAIPTMFDSWKMGSQDPWRMNMVRSKLGIMYVKWDVFGFGVDSPKSKDAEEGFTTLTSADNTEFDPVLAHAQGKYSIKAHAVGIWVAQEYKKNADGVVIQPTTIGIHPDVEAIVGSTDLAKWFKRLTLGCLQTARLVKPEVGKMTINGHTQEGISEWVLLTKGGISLPGKGAAQALWNSDAVGQRLAHYSEWVYRDFFPGNHAASMQLVNVGDWVKPGMPLASTSNQKLVSHRHGIVLDRRAMDVDTETVVMVHVGTPQLTGEAKVRSVSIKASVHHVDWFGDDDYSEILAHLGLNKDEVFIHGDLIISGLLSTDPKPMLRITEDGAKCFGKGVSMGKVNFMAETLGESVDYCALKDHLGMYNAKVAEMEAKQTRKIITIDRVNPGTYDLVQEALDNGIVHPGVSTVILNNKHYVVQHVEALLVKDLIKVESLPVSDNLTTQRTPAEVAISADAQGQDLVAKDMMSDAAQARREFTLLQQATWADLWWTPGSYKGVARTRGGVEMFNLNCINLSHAVPDSFRTRLKEMGESIEGLASLKDPLVVGYFDDNGNPTTRDGKKGNQTPEAVMIHPEVIASFAGRADEKLSVQTLTRNLLWLIGDNPTSSDVVRYILRLRGALETVAAAEKIAKQRLNRGNRAISARRRVGYIPSGWICMSYSGRAVKLMARTLGWKPDMGHPGDFVAGRWTSNYRSPQPQPTPGRVWLADAPPEKVEEFKAAGKWPVGCSAFGLRTGMKLEPHTVVQSNLAIAADGGDCDGDNLAITGHSDDPAVLAQLEGYDWRATRKEVFQWYMEKPEDPAVWAFEHDPAKTQWGRTKKTTVRELRVLTRMSIRNQTQHIGIAHGYAHKSLAVADLMGGKVWVAAQGLFFGHYEEQLAGLSDKYYRFYEALNDRMMPDNDRAVLLKGITKEINHSLRDYATVDRARWVFNCYSWLKRKGTLDEKGTPGVMEGTSYNVAAMAKIVAAGVYCDISKGDLGSAFLRWVKDNPYILDSLDLYSQANGGRVSLVHQIIRDYYAEVHSEVHHAMFPKAKDGEYLI